MTYSEGPDEFTIEQVRAAHEARGRGWACHDQRGWLLDEWDRLTQLLAEANLAFDDCTKDYAKELCEGEPWRAYRPALDDMPDLVDPDPFDDLVHGTEDL